MGSTGFLQGSRRWAVCLGHSLYNSEKGCGHFLSSAHAVIQVNITKQIHTHTNIHAPHIHVYTYKNTCAQTHTSTHIYICTHNIHTYMYTSPLTSTEAFLEFFLEGRRSMTPALKGGVKNPAFVSSEPAGNEPPVGSLLCPPKSELSTLVTSGG